MGFPCNDSLETDLVLPHVRELFLGEFLHLDGDLTYIRLLYLFLFYWISGESHF